MKNQLKKSLINLLTVGMLFFPIRSLNSSNSFLGDKEIHKINNIESISSKLLKDNYLENYRAPLEYSTNFWKNVFTTESSKSFIVNPYNLNHWKEEKSKIYKKIPNNYWVIHGKKQYIKKSVKRAYKHLDYIIDSLEKHDLPVSLSVVPLYESGFREDAISKAGAVGMWQLMAGTARDYGLKVNSRVDERLNPKKSLSAFIKYYKDSQKQFNNHLFSLVSYNVGRLPIFRYKWSKENPIKTIRSGIGFSPRNYPSMYFASKDILTNPRKYYPYIFHNKKMEKIKPKPVFFEIGKRDINYYIKKEKCF
ncbi:MAG TPA: transglycosylase SLT domain-containing protein [Candidatus Nanoarchaeia archaeon]|nr:transglycosylase SLT domain-containing protein [Candidatus Nanoarchaeia archaeon]